MDKRGKWVSRDIPSECPCGTPSSRNGPNTKYGPYIKSEGRRVLAGTWKLFRLILIFSNFI